MSKLVETTSNFFWSSVVGVIKLDNFDFTSEKIEIYCDLYVGVLSKTLKFWNVFVCCNVIIQFTFFTKPVSHMLHLKSFFPSWTDPMCIFKLPFLVKLASHTYVALQCFFSFMNCCKVSNYFSLLCKACITYVALERLFSFMNWCNVSINLFLFLKLESHVAFEWLFSFMNWCNVFVQLAFFCKASITYAPFELMPCLYSSLPFL